MTVAERALLSTQSTNPIDAVVGFLTTLHAVSSIQRVGVTHVGGLLKFCIYTRTEVDEDLSRIYRAEYEFRRQAGTVTIDVHVIPLSEVDPTALPPTQTLFER
jgi:hypothetical protein